MIPAVCRLDYTEQPPQPSTPQNHVASAGSAWPSPRMHPSPSAWLWPPSQPSTQPLPAAGGSVPATAARTALAVLLVQQWRLAGLKRLGAAGGDACAPWEWLCLGQVLSSLPAAACSNSRLAAWKLAFITAAGFVTLTAKSGAWMHLTGMVRCPFRASDPQKQKVGMSACSYQHPLAMKHRGTTAWAMTMPLPE